MDAFTTLQGESLSVMAVRIAELTSQRDRAERELAKERQAHAETRRHFQNIMDQLHAFEEKV